MRRVERLAHLALAESLCQAKTKDGATGYDIFILPDGKGKKMKLVGGVGTCDPRWSPSGTQLTYQTEANICVIGLDGKKGYRVTFGGGVQHYATWGPDERNIAYCQGKNQKGPWSIYVTSLVEEEDPVKLTKEGSCMYPDWGTVHEK